MNYGWGRSIRAAPAKRPTRCAFAIPMDTPGLKFICRETYDTGRSKFDRPLSSRFDEEDALAIFDDVTVPWERVFVNGDIEIFNGLMSRGPGYAMLARHYSRDGQVALSAPASPAISPRLSAAPRPSCAGATGRIDRQRRIGQRTCARGRTGSRARRDQVACPIAHSPRRYGC